MKGNKAPLANQQRTRKYRGAPGAKEALEEIKKRKATTANTQTSEERSFNVACCVSLSFESSSPACVLYYHFASWASKMNKRTQELTVTKDDPQMEFAVFLGEGETFV